MPPPTLNSEEPLYGPQTGVQCAWCAAKAPYRRHDHAAVAAGGAV